MQREVIDESVDYMGKQMVCETDLEGKITFVNRAFKTMTGFEVGEVVGQTFELIRHPDVPMCLFSKMWDALKGLEDWSGYLKVFTKEGKYFWTSLFITPIKNDDGSVKGYTAAFGEAEALMIEKYSKLYKEAVEKELCSEGMVVDMSIANLAGH